MDAWYIKVRQMKDESENTYLTKKFTDKVFYDLSHMRIREKGKFKNRMGPEFEHWVAGLATEYSNELINSILGDDDFWNLTLKLTLGV
jgi:hypothetical protein